jgi:hypothetical protein
MSPDIFMLLATLIFKKSLSTHSYLICKRSIVDAQGKRLSVVLEFDYYQKLLARLEELEEIYAFDLADESQDEAIPFAQAIA